MPGAGSDGGTISTSSSRIPTKWATPVIVAKGMELAFRGVPLPVTQQLLGHSDPRTTSIYTTAHASDLTATLDDAGLL